MIKDQLPFQLLYLIVTLAASLINPKLHADFKYMLHGGMESMGFGDFGTQHAPTCVVYGLSSEDR